MKKVHISTVAAMLAITTSAWAAGIEPYPESALGQDASTKTRSEVITELHEALRLGQIEIGEGDFPNTRLDAQTGDTATAPGDAGRSQARMRAETIEAGRLGLLSSGEGDPPIATAEQEESIAAAGRLAADALVSAQSPTLPAAE